MAAFIYLGFLAAGDEIGQPFGYDEVSKLVRSLTIRDIDGRRRMIWTWT